MKKIRVKLSFEWKSLPIERQTPNQAGEWGNCKFYINQNRGHSKWRYWHGLYPLKI